VPLGQRQPTEGSGTRHPTAALDPAAPPESRTAGSNLASHWSLTQQEPGQGGAMKVNRFKLNKKREGTEILMRVPRQHRRETLHLALRNVS
jgi:hypothetical protein